MDKTSITLRPATTADAQQLLEIYTPYVEKTVITFEYEVPTLEDFKSRIAHTLEKYPYFVAEQDGRILGYAYAGTFKGRAAYDWAVETTIYLDEKLQRMGLGKRMYAALEDICRKMGILNLYACIGYPETDDEYLTKNSAQFHAHLGYRMVGEFKQCGYKFDRWYNMVWMEKMIGEHTAAQKRVRTFSEILPELEFEKY